MPYYLADTIVGPRRGRLVPVGWDSQPNRNWIVLGNRALIWLETAIVDSRLLKVADDKAENLAVASRNALATLLGDRTYKPTDNFQFAVTDLLRVPPAAKGWKALRPSFFRQRYEIWLGPGGRGRNLFYDLPTLVLPSTKTFVDDFNRTANLGGSTSSDGLFTWTELVGTVLTTNGTVCTATNIPSNTEPTAYTSADTDTDTSYAQIDLTTYTRATNTELTVSIMVRSNITDTNGYPFYVSIDDANAAGRELWALSSLTLLASDAVDSTTGLPNTLYVEADGSSISSKVDGAAALGPITNSGEASGAGNRRALFRVYSFGNSTNDAAFDNFGYGDLAVAGRRRLIRP